MSDPALLKSWRAITLILFPWLKGFVLSTVTKGLRVLAAADKLHLQGDAGDPAAARVGDFVVRLGLNAGVPSYSTSAEPPYTWLPIPPGTGPGAALLPTDAGAAIAITAGSTKVTIG